MEKEESEMSWVIEQIFMSSLGIVDVEKRQVGVRERPQVYFYALEHEVPGGHHSAWLAVVRKDLSSGGKEGLGVHLGAAADGRPWSR